MTGNQVLKISQKERKRLEAALGILRAMGEHATWEIAELANHCEEDITNILAFYKKDCNGTEASGSGMEQGGQERECGPVDQAGRSGASGVHERIPEHIQEQGESAGFQTVRERSELYATTERQRLIATAAEQLVAAN